MDVQSSDQVMIKDSTTSIYVIDRGFHIIYFNSFLQNSFPNLKTGDICYKVLCGESKPCQNCPAMDRPHSNQLFYNKLIQSWLEVDFAKIEWPQVGECTLISARLITEANRNLFLNLAQISVYDELFELNYTQNTYKILYHKPNKYVIPSQEGTLDRMVVDVSENMIHPDDKKRFLEFWNVDDSQGFIEKPESQIARGQFRKKLVQGGYCWVSQIVVPISQEPHDDEIVICFIQDIQESKPAERQLPAEEKERDPMTGLMMRQAFLEAAEKRLEETDEKYALAAIDIEHFKLYNEWYGQKAGDEFLVKVARRMLRLERLYDCVCGYFGNDDFVILFSQDGDVLEKINQYLKAYSRESPEDVGFMPTVGIYNIGERTRAVSQMYDYACIAQQKAKGNYNSRISYYDETMKLQMERNQMLLNEVQRALNRGEFIFYAQPKYNMITGKITGLESLIRWDHPDRGIIMPGEFIPILEANGFITRLDLYLWEHVCKALANWIAAGHKPVPISVNVSRVDIVAIDVATIFQDLCNKYKLPYELLEIEITETAYSENYAVIPAVVDSLRRIGFTVLMDDFGKGYSSLNMLKDVNVDILKLDIKFLEFDVSASHRGSDIIKTIVRMARLMNLKLIAEGVETEEQVRFLCDVGCIYGQGYYFNKPLPVKEFEALLLDEDNIDFDGIQLDSIGPLHINDFLRKSIVDESMLNDILGAVAIYQVKEDNVELLQVNEHYYDAVGYHSFELEEHKDSILSTIFEEDRKRFLELFRTAKQSGKKAARGVLRHYTHEGKLQWLQIRLFFLKEKDGYSSYYAALNDITSNLEYIDRQSSERPSDDR